MKKWGLLVLVFMPCLALAENESSEKIDVTETANFFANCAGVWDFNADVMEADGKPATAERLHNMGNGAQTAALWLLASQHALNAGKATKYGSWLDMVTPKREDARLRLRGLAEMSEFKQIETESNACLGAAAEQEGILTMMREDRVRTEQEATTP